MLASINEQWNFLFLKDLCNDYVQIYCALLFLSKVLLFIFIYLFIIESIQSQDASFTATDTLPYIETSNGKSTSHSERKREEVKQSSPIKKTKKQTSPKHISQEKSPQHKQSPSKAHGQAPEAEDSNNQKNRISQPMIEPEKPQFTEEETHFKYNANRKSSKDDKMGKICYIMFCITGCWYFFQSFCSLVCISM